MRIEEAAYRKNVNYERFQAIFIENKKQFGKANLYI